MTIEEAERELIPAPEVVLHRFSGSREFMDKFIREFPRDPSLAAFRESCKTENWNQIMMGAHTIKGTSGNLGFEKLFNTTTSLVSAIRKDDFSAAKIIIPLVLQEIETVCNVLSKVE
jgi:Hpt domain.